MAELGRIGTLPTFFHIGELVAQRSDAALGKALRHLLHRAMRHADAGAVGKHVRGARASRLEPKRRDAVRVVDLDLQGLGIGSGHAGPYIAIRWLVRRLITPLP